MGLPATFRLTARIEASPRAMKQLRIAGCPLAPEGGLATDDYLEDYFAIYDVVIRRGTRSLKVEVKRHEENPEAAPGESLEFDLDPAILNDARWLSITPADETVRFKSLVMTW